MAPVVSADHRYAARREGDQHLTIYRDDSVPTRAALLFFHGGGWRGGSRLVERVQSRLVPLAAHGIEIVSADYRLSGAAKYPAQLEDVGDALEWVAERYETPVFLSGASAGGHLAALLGLGAWERLSGRSHRVAPSGVITYALVSDPLAYDAERLQEPLPEPGTFAHWAYRRDGEWPPGGLGARLLSGGDSTVSPVVTNHVGHDAPPFLILHGDRDTCVRFDQSQLLFDALSRRGNRAHLVKIAGADHEDPRFDEPVIRGAIAGFIEQYSVPVESRVEAKPFFAS